MADCTLTTSVTCDAEASVQIAAGRSASLPLWLDQGMPVSAMVRLPARSDGAQPVGIAFLLDGVAMPAATSTNADLADPTWVAVGPFEVPAGRHRLEFATVCPDGPEWPAGTEPIHLAKVTLGSVAVLPEVLASEPERHDLFEGPPGFDYFTSFDETGLYFFLSYVPWIYNRAIVSGPVLQQAAAFALSGSYSCLFTESITGTSALETQNLNIPVGSATATLGGWIYVGSSAVVIDVHIMIDGTDAVSSWSFNSDDVGKWVERYSTVTLAPGAHQFYGWVKLRASSQISSNKFWLDNYGVDFAPLVQPQDSYCLFGDIEGNVYALAESARGTAPPPVWRKSLSGGQILAPLTVSDGTAYVIVSGLGATLFALRVRDGAQLRSAQLGEHTEASAAILGQSVLAVTADGWLRAYKVADGTLQWSLDAFQAGPGGHVQINGVVVELDRMFVTTDTGICAIDLVGRTVLWKYAGPKVFPNPVAVGADNIYAGSSDARLYAFDAAAGTLRWSYPTGGAINSVPQVVSGAVIFGSDDSTLYTLRERDGVSVARLTLPGRTIRCFLLYSNQLYVVGNAISGAILGYTLSLSSATWTWTRNWTRPLTNGAQADPAVDGDDVYITASDGNVYSLNASDGSVTWSFSPDAVVGAAPVVAPPLARAEDALKFSDVCWLCTHNAYANVDDGWFYAQQGPSIPAQLDDGVRALMLDIWVCGNEVVYAHEGCGTSVLIMKEEASFLPFATSLAQIRDWLDANPTEIVTLLLEQRTGSKALTQAAVTQSGIGSYVFDPVADWNVLQNGWPTLLWMINAGKRLVVLSDWGKGVQWIPGGDGFGYVWTYCVENDYGDASMNGQCNARPFSGVIQGSNGLFIQNYNVDFSANWVEPHAGTTLWRRFDRLNDSNRIMQLVQGCNSLRGRLPNFLAVDWYQNGYNGGPREAVAQINALRRPNP